MGAMFRLAVVAAVMLLINQSSFANAPTTAPTFTDADYEAHVKTLKAKLPAGFTVIIQKPFAVIGNDSARNVQSSAEHTIQWAVELLKKEYFDQDPADILDVYLFKDKASYDKYTREWFDGNPGTPYGYYSPRHKALIMNIGTGGGTLVHEIVHPFIATNFPNCPSWFNEGLGSLYEQSGERDGRIIGRTNWRLAGLKEAIKKKTAPSFEDLCAMDSATFYGSDRGDNYAAARYLLYYLQEKGLLRDYYKSFVKNQKEDPTGYTTLKQSLAATGHADMNEFRQQWETWVMGLQYP